MEATPGERATASGVELTSHSFRHFAASALISGGASVKQVQTFLGHASAVITPRTYAHMWPGDEDRTRNVFDAALSPLTSQSDSSRTVAAPKQRSRRSEAQEPQAAFLVHQNDRFVTVAVSDDVARRVNDLERANREGPCLDAIVDDAPQLEPDLTSTSQWPQLARQVLLDSPVRGVAGFRIIIEQKKVGALNIFSDRSGALTMASASHGIILASFGP